MRSVRTLLASALLAACPACESDGPAPIDTSEPPLCERVPELDALAAPESYEYDWTCSGEVAPADEPLPDDPVADDCTSGVWPELDDTVDVCPTVSDQSRTDPVSGRQLPSADGRPLPTEIPVTEAGSFLPAGLPASWPSSLRLVAWNMEYTAHLDEQLAALTSMPELASADVFLLSEVDRCSARNDLRRAARLLAEALDAAYAYGIEFVELEIDRVIGGDTGQAIISRRPLSSVALTCHSSQYDWFASQDEPRLGQRVVLHADVPVGATSVRLYAAHLESNDLFGDKRSVQAKELLDVAQARACDRPQIVGGDFNAPYCGAPELQIFRDAGFIDALAVAGDTGPTHGGLTRLDYVWTRGFRVVDGGVVRDLGVSDHDALWVDLELD
jgi:endonuclease/exonuclease/phosphatase family metal-dependent hydrolase